MEQKAGTDSLVDSQKIIINLKTGDQPIWNSNVMDVCGG